MCTAISYGNGTHFFGRNLDLEYSYNETVTVTPRNFPFRFSSGIEVRNHFAIIGMAFVNREYPLYYDATNEKGLSIAGLNFPENAVYHKAAKKNHFIASFELIPWLLSSCSTVAEVKDKLNGIEISDISFSPELPPSPLHWFAADAKESVTIEPLAEGLKIYDNPVGVLTNNPVFEYHLHHLTQYLNLTHSIPENRFSSQLTLKPYCKGMGAFGLPGDHTSPSRFIRAAFVKWNSVCAQTKDDSICQFFHILGSVEQQRGCVQVQGDRYEITHYTSCCDTEKRIYYYRTYTNSQISAVNLYGEDLESEHLVSYPLMQNQQIYYHN